MNFNNLENIISKITPSSSDYEIKSILKTATSEINNLFKQTIGIECDDIYYSSNTKDFFGMQVAVKHTKNDIYSVFLNEEIKKDKYIRYVIDIDSKLIKECMLSTREIIAVLLHEVGHIVVNKYNNLKEVSDYINLYTNKKNINIKSIGVKNNIPLCSFILNDSIYMINSVFRKKDEENIADEFAISYGYGSDLLTALKKINRIKNRTVLNNINKLSSLHWLLNIFTFDVELRRVPLIKTLTKAKNITDSKIYKDCIQKSIDNENNNKKIVNESFCLENNLLFKKIKKRSYKQIELELYELSIKVNNCEDKDEGLSILRQLNYNINILDDMIESEPLSDDEFSFWNDVLYKYKLLRDSISNKKLYDDNYYGLFVKTPVIKSRYEI